MVLVRRGRSTSGVTIFSKLARAFVFGIDWLRNGIPIEKETSVLQGQAEAVAEAMRRSVDVLERHPGSEPDSFRLTDPTGRICGVFFLRTAAGRQHPSHRTVLRSRFSKRRI
jgi:hypothetical protein